MRRRARIGFDAFATCLVVLVTFGLACLMPAQNDTWWQLAAGREIWRTGHVPTTEHWSATAAGRHWPDHEWLWQVLAYALHHVGGMPLLSVAQALAAVLAVVVVHRLARPSGRVGIVLLVPAFLLVSPEWSLRPQVVSLLLLAVLLHLLVRERLVAVPLLFLLWANVHAGVASGGVVLVAATALALAHRVRRDSPDARSRLRTLLVVTPLSALATLVNPLGIGLWRYVLGASHDPAHAWINDWSSAWQLGPVEALFWAWVLALLGSLVLRRSRYAGWAEQVPLVAGLVLSVLAVVALRNAGFFVLAALPAVTVAWSRRPPSGAAPAPGSATGADDVPAGRVVLVAVALVTVLAVALVWLARPVRLGWDPMSPAAAHAVAGCPGPVYNTYDEGGFLLWFTPRVRVFVDSRQDPYPTAFLRRAMFATRGAALVELVGDHAIRCAVVAPGAPAVSTLGALGWRTTYADAAWVVLQRP